MQLFGPVQNERQQSFYIMKSVSGARHVCVRVCVCVAMFDAIILDNTIHEAIFFAHFWYVKRL